MTISPMMINKLRAAGANDVLQQGASWIEADTYMRNTFLRKPSRNSSGNGAFSSSTSYHHGNGTVEEEVLNIYISPFDHPEIWNGVSTLVSELVHQLPPREKQQEQPANQQAPTLFPADAIVCSVGGGGLFNGIVKGLGDYHAKASKFNSAGSTTASSDTRGTHVLAVETTGADSLAYSIRQGSLQRMPAITSLATSLGASLVAEKTYENAISPPPRVDVSSVVVSDADAARGVVSLLDETRLLVELASAVCVNVAVGKGDGKQTPLKEAVKGLGPESRVVVVVCGGSNVTADQVVEWRKNLAEGWE